MSRSESPREGFSIIPNHLLGQLTANELAVYVAVRSYYPNPYPSHEALAERAGMSVSTLQRTLNGMKAKGVLDWEHQHRDKGGQTTNRYALSDETPRNRSVKMTDPLGQDDRPPSVKMTDELNKGELNKPKGGGEHDESAEDHPPPSPPPPHFFPRSDPSICSKHGLNDSDQPCHGCRRAREYRESPDYGREQRRTRAAAERDDRLMRQHARRRDDERMYSLADLIPDDLQDRPMQDRLAWLAQQAQDIPA